MQLGVRRRSCFGGWKKSPIVSPIAKMPPSGLGLLYKLQRETGRLHVYLVVSPPCVVTIITVVAACITILLLFREKWLESFLRYTTSK